MGKRPRRVLASVVLAALCQGAWAQDLSADGVLSLRGDAWSSDRDLNDGPAVAAGSAWARGRIDAGAAGQLAANGWVRAQNHGDAPHGRVRELYWRQEFGPVSVRLGRQMVVWGRADGLNPTDNLSPRDLTLLAPEDGDLRHGNEALKLETAVPLGSVSLLWFPRAASHIIPLERQPGVSYRRDKPRAGQWALRWEVSGVGASDGEGGIDGSLSYFDGRDPMPDLLPGRLGAGGLEVVLRNQRLRVFGADMSTVHNGVVWRAEAALTRTDSQGAADFTHKKPQLWLVGGPEWSLPESTTLGLQATVLHVDRFGDPDQWVSGPLRELAWRQLATSGQSGRNQAGVLWRLARRLNNDTVTLETNGVALWGGPGGASGLLRARAEVALDDHWQLLVGGDRYFGHRYSSFGQLRANSALYVQLRYGL
ncbi:hypothetical protein [Azohydromonas caseinilytica]|uniref:Porin n=1 Tax=Azohydromonas caseinilytica TaxID=2728836 RepID=A0A848FGL4_9BURK|nr:hypothetical protein [Azohydromonas caseinilytica]NML17995.1 porin [Azohydromonas caseinilytica]